MRAENLGGSERRQRVESRRQVQRFEVVARGKCARCPLAEDGRVKLDLVEDERVSDLRDQVASLKAKNEQLLEELRSAYLTMGALYKCNFQMVDLLRGFGADVPRVEKLERYTREEVKRLFDLEDIF